MRVHMEGMGPFTAGKSTIVQIPARTPFHAETVGDAPVLRFEVTHTGTLPIYADGETPTPIAGQDYVRVSYDAAPPPALPASTPGTSAVLSNPGATTIPVVDGFQEPASVGWLAEDFKQVAPDTLDLLEQWRIADKVSLAEEGKLSGAVVRQIEKDAAFPAPANRSLQSSSPAALAKLFNTLNVPVALKSYITTCPTILYLIVRDMQQRSEIRKIIQSEAERASKPTETTKAA
jgi:hypothetical protein